MLTCMRAVKIEREQQKKVWNSIKFFDWRLMDVLQQQHNNNNNNNTRNDVDDNDCMHSKNCIFMPLCSAFSAFFVWNLFFQGQHI